MQRFRSAHRRRLAAPCGTGWACRPAATLLNRRPLKERWPKLILPVLLASLILGLGLRATAWAWGRSLDGDELSLYLNAERYDGWRLIAGRLDATPSTQAGPSGFLLVIDGLMDLMPRGEVRERTLRLVPLIASLIALPLAWMAAVLAGRRARVSVWPVVLLVVVGIAISERLIDIAQRIKPYGNDVAATLVLLMVALWLSEATAWKRRLATALAAGVLAWWSQPIVMTFAAWLGLDVIATLRRREGVGWPSLLGAAATAGACFAPVIYAATGQRDPFLDEFWTLGFAPWRDAWWVPFWLGDAWLEIIEYGLRPLAVLLTPLAIVGLVRAWRWPIVFAALGAAPLAVTAAGLAHVYPLVPQRVNLFVTPSVLLLAGIGASVCLTGTARWRRSRSWMRATRWRRGVRLATAVILVIVLVSAVPRAVRDLVRPPPDVAPAVETARASGLPMIAFDEPTAWHFEVYEPDASLVGVWMPRTAGVLPADLDEAVLVIGPKPGGDDAARLKDAIEVIPSGVSFERIDTGNRSSALLRLRRDGR